MALTDRLSGLWKQYSDRRSFRQDLASQHPENSGMTGFGKVITLLSAIYYLASPAKAQDFDITIQGNVTREYDPNHGIKGIPLTFSGEAFTNPVDTETQEEGWYVVNMIVDALPDKTTIPIKYQIGDYPDPFNPHSNIYFTLPKAEHVTLEVYNVLGQKMKTLVNDDLRMGLHEFQWDATNQNGMSVADGVYFYIMRAGKNHIERGKMVYLKESRSGSGGLYKPTTSTSTESDVGTSVNSIDGDSLEVRVDLAETDSTEAGIVTFYVGKEGVYTRDFTVRLKNQDRFQGELTDLVQGDARRGILEIDGVQYPISNGVFDQRVPQGNHTVRYWLTDESGDPSSFIVTQQFDQGNYQDLDLTVASSDHLVWDEGGQELVTFQEMRDFHNYGNIGLFGANWRIGLKKPIVPDSVRQVYIVYENPVTGDIMDPEWAQNIKDSINIDILDKVVARFGEDVRIPVHIGYEGDPLMDEATYVSDPPDPFLLPRHGWHIIYIDNDLAGGNGIAVTYDDNKDNLIDRGVVMVSDPNNIISIKSFYGIVQEEFETIIGFPIGPPDGDPEPDILTANQSNLHNHSSLNRPSRWDLIWLHVNFNPEYPLKATLDEIYGMPSLGKTGSIAVPQTPIGYERTNPGLLVPKSPKGYEKKESGLFIPK